MSQLSDEDQIAVRLVAEIWSGAFSELESDEKLVELRKNLIDPGLVDLMFHEKPVLSDEDVVRRAREYRPFAL
ncbi:hypothetical protein [Streptacidiphilus pinicola]|uniref:hypothetical protein n=1 Tax=Streptacidiphilus pinicola TaxID=2219663 RepID=UPI001057CB96|nr:hypothetical protein [Streptacidiphilus pinicola]